MSSTSSGTNWHSLPREIRDCIYEIILEYQNPPPSKPDCAGERSEVGYHPGPGYNYRSFHYQSDAPSTSVVLLQLCRQINAEVSELIAWKNRENATSPLTYYLDCMIQGYKAWPTWICLPAINRRVSNLKVDLRIFQEADDDEEACHIYVRPLQLITPLLQILNHLFHHGPHLFQQERSSRPLRVATLTLNIIFAEATNSCKAHAFDYFETFVRGIHEVLCRVESRGVLFGHVEDIACSSAFQDADVIIHVQPHIEGQESAHTLHRSPLWRAMWGPNPPLRHV